jgi:hypothetical protein
VKVEVWHVDPSGWFLGFTRYGIQMTSGPFYARAFALVQARYMFGDSVEVQNALADQPATKETKR